MDFFGKMQAQGLLRLQKSYRGCLVIHAHSGQQVVVSGIFHDVFEKGLKLTFSMQVRSLRNWQQRMQRGLGNRICSVVGLSRIWWPFPLHQDILKLVYQVTRLRC